ncbi:membrane-bound lytic murein transglycosylase D [Hymenobacter luteus]|uniref:Membrane-bound lytic murein transglycosylase D n=2 Tax=Hymenobacter TaxID=89966 RepID=A0A7W9SYY8_9BACT|nr:MULTISPECIES: LysM peptidoglycan-binding domain-containing protein [Hymenobacter]MBB4600221.1 membrane-bound lytic murein transglycosylase D [Hymenobacter latericoloratus]MBB6057469.1 membrane-bound lytic murein transglycosylase D [Hymenobacter luteus]
MRRIVLLLFLLLPLLAAAQTVPVPTNLSLAGLRLRLTEGGRTAIQQKVDALRRHPASFQARVVLADAYFPLIDRVFQQEGLPLDFHFLALQESGLQGDAQSIHDAVGYWQFKRESAADFGLLMNDAVDERKHIVASSKAAAQYLLRNNKVLRNWANSLLSYNLGLTGTKPYTLPTDADATEVEISEQTHPYILTFLAHKVAFESAVGLNTRPPLLFQEFPAPAGKPLSIMAQALQQNPEDLAKHNRWLLAPTVPTDRVYTMLVPITDPLQLTALAAQQKNATAGQLLNQPTADPENADFVRVNGLRALIALPGDTKESLAKRAGLKMKKFMQYNDLFAFDNIVPGQPYFVQKKRDKAAVEYHVARPGESVATVSQKYGVRAKAIWSKNRMPRNEELRPGRVLWLQHTRPKNVPVEYADGNNATAMAAFEKPVTAAAPAVAPAPAAATPAPAATKQPEKKRKADEAEPYMGRTAGSARILEDAVEEESSTVVQPDSATDEHTENLNNLPPALPAAATPGATDRPTTAPPAPKKPLPTAAPVADEPEVSEAPTEAAAQPLPPATRPTAAPAPAPTPITKPEAPAASAAAPTNRPAPPAIAAPAATPVEAVPANGLHTVQPKENLYSVARRFGLRPADIVLWNNLPQNPSLRIGQVLRVAAPGAPTPAAPATPAPVSRPAPATPKPAAPAPAPAPAAAASVQHTVQPGETMYSISRKYKVTIKQIMEWNSKPDFAVKPGEVLLIKPAQ